ncbi:ABC transporter substrate-binding protein [Bacillus thermotolerans]|uniref:Hydroxymethylpyrimidine ABC transporter, substrate-binding component n=1 Tax=Bacillus thermotolerans TaxID=1221996 RepID=A0A0F5I0E1_BACTR|nr:ABC transporter substrate-binding protein [Bacillus thermotolerans]KKB39124.1 Hydroxymethylpyrimidine ABC transporter, substrate-binding component [Bacillus thermotolerans]KKB41589.1 Hydroxymethylpyrimidine ABC transporter, substrate-binding component [Bacillus thermotolerans]KKB42744.1 Hydroxymethylpyrimidine ABC transporter, substrate-binding component [Bacillus thermotolerans]
MRKWLYAAIVLLLVGCGSEEANEAVPAGEEKKEKVTVMLDWYPNAVHSFLYTAEEKGYFEEEGIDVDIQFPANPTDPINLAAAGKVTLGITYQPDVIAARTDQGVNVKSVGAIVRSPLNHVVFLKDSPIQSPQDMEGRTVGYPGIPLNEAIIETMVKHDGGDPEKVKLTDVGFELNSAVVTGNTDAVVGAYINHEVPLLEHEGYEVSYLNPTDYGVPSFYELVAVTSDQTWEEEKESIQAFWRAAEKGFEFMESHPDEALQILLDKQDASNFPLIEEVEKESIEVLLPKMKSETGFGSQTKEAWEETAEWMKEAGLVKGEPQIEEMFVNPIE